MTTAPQPTGARRWTPVYLGIAALLAALLAFASTASAARDPIASGDTDLHMKKGFLHKLSVDGITVGPLGSAEATGSKIGLTLGQGMLDPTNVEGHVEPQGGFKLMRGKRGVPIYHLSVNTVRKAVYAQVARAHMEIGTFRTPTMAREGFGANFKAPQLFLNEKVTRLISNRLGLRGHQRLNAGRVLSNVYVAAQPRTVTVLPQGEATWSASSTLLTKLSLKGVKPNDLLPIAPGKAGTPATNLKLPIAGGTLAPDGSEGSVYAGGGIEIKKQTATLSPQLNLQNVQLDLDESAATFEMDLLPKPPFPGPTGRSPVASVTLPAGSVVADPATRQITIKGAELRLQANAATTFNNLFNQPAPEPAPASNFIVGDPLGTLSLTLQAE